MNDFILNDEEKAVLSYLNGKPVFPNKQNMVSNLSNRMIFVRKKTKNRAAYIRCLIESMEKRGIIKTDTLKNGQILYYANNVEVKEPLNYASNSYSVELNELSIDEKVYAIFNEIEPAIKLAIAKALQQ